MTLMKPRLNIILLITIASIAMLCSCAAPTQKKSYDPAQVNFSVTFNPLFSNCIYPSLVLGLNNYNADMGNMYLFSVELTAPKDKSVVRIVIDSSSLNYVTIEQDVMEKKGQRYTFHPNIKWKYDNLYATRKQGSVDFTFTCYINDEEVDVKNMKLNYRSVNECLLSARSKGHVQDFRWLFAGYVNEDHPKIDQILAEILDNGIVSAFNGYQSKDPKAVKNQVKAIWYYALNRGITYSSISCTSNPSQNANVQHIRFFDEVYNNRQANCIDACVFFASIMRKIGLEPIIFVEPCHAYLGYYTDNKRKHVELLETTITSWVNFPDLERNLDPTTGLPNESRHAAATKYLNAKQREQYEAGKMDIDQLKRCIADSIFVRATQYDREKYEANEPHFQDTSMITFQQLIISDLRKLVQPIN